MYNTSNDGTPSQTIRIQERYCNWLPFFKLMCRIHITIMYIPLVSLSYKVFQKKKNLPNFWWSRPQHQNFGCRDSDVTSIAGRKLRREIHMKIHRKLRGSTCDITLKIIEVCVWGTACKSTGKVFKKKNLKFFGKKSRS